MKNNLSSLKTFFRFLKKLSVVIIVCLFPLQCYVVLDFYDQITTFQIKRTVCEQELEKYQKEVRDGTLVLESSTSGVGE
jgi:hypothetical protein